jgi:hypothetical protein
MPKPSSQENTTERKVMTNKPDFCSWSQANLAKFADDVYVKLQEQNDIIQQLQCDLKTALEAYRALNTTDTKQA